MFEAFKIGITIALTNTVSSALGAMRKDFGLTHIEAEKLRSTLDKITKLGMGAAVAGSITMGLTKALGASYEAAKNYEMAFSRFKALNLGDVVNSQADKFARSANVMGASATELMATMRDLTSVTGDPRLAMQLAPKFAQMSYANQAIFGEGAGMRMDASQIRALEKIIEIKGGYKDASTFLKQADMMQHVISGTGGMVKPSDFLQFIKTAGVSGRLLNDQMFYYTMEPLIQEMTGGRVGTGTMSAYNNLAQGRSTVRSAREMMRLGLLNPHDVDYDKIGQVKAIHPGALKGFDQFTSDPYHWMQQILIPALQKAGLTTQGQMMNEMGAIFGNRTGSNLFSLMLMQQEKIEKNMGISKNAMGTDQLIAMANGSPVGAQHALSAAWDSVKTNAGTALVPLAVAVLVPLSKALGALSEAIARHPSLARDLAYATVALTAFFGVLTAACVTGGAILLLAAVGPLLAPIFAVGGTIFLVVAGLGLLAGSIYSFWDQIHGLLHKDDPAKANNGGFGTPYASRFVPGGSPKINNNAGSFMAGAPYTGGRQPLMMTTYVQIDRQTIGKAVTNFMSDGMNGPQTSGNLFDSRSSYLPATP